MEQSDQNENPPDETPAKITNADTLRCEVANDLDDSHQASHRCSCKVFIGCKAFGTETGIWCGWPISGPKTKAAPATVSGLGLSYTTGKPGRRQIIMPPARRPACKTN